MKLSKYIENLTLLLQQEGNIDCYYSKDDEGNGYQEVNYEPSVMYEKLKDYGELLSLESIKEMIEDGELEEDEINSRFDKVICVN